MNITYNRHAIPKGNNKYRILYEPNPILKAWQLKALEQMYEVKPHNCNHGFVPERSIATNAFEHIGRKYVLSMDIKSFFPNTNKSKVEKILARFFPKWYEFLPRFIWQNHVPQGAPTSPHLANFALWDFDDEMDVLCKENNISYTRYADDLTFSYDDKANTRLLFKTVNKKLNKYDYWLSKKKTHLMPAHRRQKVTGFVVNQKLNLPREKRNQIRAYNHLLDRSKWKESDKEWLMGLNGYKGMTNLGKIKDEKERN